MDEIPFSLRLDDSSSQVSPGDQMSVKARLQKALTAADSDAVATMLDLLWAAKAFHVQRAPHAGLIMYTVRDPFDTPFHLGELLVTEAEVILDGHTGYSAVCGDDPERALLLAAVEAVERNGRSAVLDVIATLLDSLEALSIDQKTLASKLAAATEVRFDSMKKETVDFGSLGG